MWGAEAHSNTAARPPAEYRYPRDLVTGPATSRNHLRREGGAGGGAYN
jgi:hypothetical protein